MIVMLQRMNKCNSYFLNLIIHRKDFSYNSKLMSRYNIKSFENLSNLKYHTSSIYHKIYDQTEVKESENVSNTSNNNATEVAEMSTTDDESKYNSTHLLIYKGNQELTILGMFAASSFNFLYWSYYLVSIYYETFIPNPVILVGDSTWGYVGTFCTGLIIYFTKQYANNTIRRCYIAKDDSALRIQVYNFIAGAGSYIDVPVGKVRLHTAAKALDTSYIPISVDGRDTNLVFSKTGQYFDRDRLYIFLNSTSGKLDSKEERTKFYKKKVSR